MHYDDRSTVCVSSQAGCAMGCSFCATGKAGFDRQLRVGEIVEQVVRAGRRSRQDGRRLRSEEHTSELQSLMRLTYDVFRLKKKSRVSEELRIQNTKEVRKMT